MSVSSDRPEDATGRYRDFNGRETWIKDVGGHPEWMLGRLWSDAKHRWRVKREHVYQNRMLPFDPAI